MDADSPSGFSSFRPHLCSPEEVPSTVRAPVPRTVVPSCFSQKQCCSQGPAPSPVQRALEQARWDSALALQLG